MEDEKNDHSEKENILILLGDYVAVRNFSNTDAGKLFHTICRYALGENIGDLEDKIQVAFSFFKVRLDENRKNWEKTRIERKKAGRLGGLAKQANANFAKQNEQNVANVAVNVSDSVGVNDINDSVGVNNIKNKDNIDKRDLIKKSDIIILSTPHQAYKKLKIGKNKILIDVWGLIDKG